jgi:hypothetical protein
MSTTTTDQPSGVDEYHFEGEVTNREGAEQVYSFVLSERSRFVARAIRRRQVDLEIFLTRDDAEPGSLVVAPAVSVDVELGPGRYRLFIDGHRRRAGGYLLVADVPTDRREPYSWSEALSVARADSGNRGRRGLRDGP